MTDTLDPQELRQMQTISGGMLAGALVYTGIAFWQHRTNPGTLEFMAYAAIAVGVLAPVLVAVLERSVFASAAPRARFIAVYGLLEGLTLFCLTALIVAPNDWPLLAAALPLGTMILRFPRAS